MPAAIGAIALVIALGIALEHVARELRVRTGPHAYFVMSSRAYVVGGGFRRGGRLYEHDYIIDGPFPTLARCKAELSGSEATDYCRALLLSDAQQLRVNEYKPDF